MKATLRNQFKHEHKAWGRSLEFFRQENALLKYRLSEMVDNNEENKFLQIAEYFQNELLLKDDMLNKILKEIHGFSDKFNEYQNEDGLSEKNITRQDQLRNDILLFEKIFLDLSKRFNEQLLQSI